MFSLGFQSLRVRMAGAVALSSMGAIFALNRSDSIAQNDHGKGSRCYALTSLKDQTVLITGATAGIGEACAWRFAGKRYNDCHFYYPILS
jgi:hypothetical protein